MKYKMYGALIASVGAIALLPAANDAFARSGGAPRAGVAPHSVSRPFIGHSFRHHRRNDNVGILWPGYEGFYDGPSGEPVADAVPPASNDVRYTSTYDVPWDWAHRFPPNVAPSDRPYVSSCPAESITVPGRGGTEHTVNVMRCY